jgi:hypothetical protein
MDENELPVRIELHYMSHHHHLDREPFVLGMYPHGCLDAARKASASKNPPVEIVLEAGSYRWTWRRAR